MIIFALPKPNTMKKIVLFAVATMLAAACTKDRKCSCTSTSELNGVKETESQTYTIKEATKGQARANCISTTQTYTSGLIVTNDCKLD